MARILAKILLRYIEDILFLFKVYFNLFVQYVDDLFVIWNDENKA